MLKRRLRLQEVKQQTGLSRSSIYAQISGGSFPRPYQSAIARLLGSKMKYSSGSIAGSTADTEFPNEETTLLPIKCHDTIHWNPLSPRLDRLTIAKVKVGQIAPRLPVSGGPDFGSTALRPHHQEKEN